MAWANGNKRWTLPFVSLNGTSCRVDIYQRGYTGSTVTTLTGAENPFEYEEDDDSDLLNGVIRYRTGYLRVIEENHGELDDLYPLVNNAHYIEFYYGSTLDFNGFIQAQEFENDWAPGPRVIELPVMSPLGLAEGIYFDYTDFNPPRWLAFRDILKYIFNAIDISYDGFYFPKILSKRPADGNVMDNLFVNSLTFCPFGSDYNKESSNITGIYEPKTVEDALNMICTAFGVILHDLPGKPIFQRVDYTGDYVKFDLTYNFDIINQGITNITNIATVSSADNSESVIMPLSEIVVTYAGEAGEPSMTFERCRGYSRGCMVPDREFCTNLPMINDLQGTFTYAETINSDGNLSTTGKVCLGAYGGNSLSEMIMYRTANWASGTLIAKYTFFEWYENLKRLRFKFQFGYGLEGLNNEQFGSVIGVTIRYGNFIWNSASGSWVRASSGYSQTFNGLGNEDCEIVFSLHTRLDNPTSITVEFYVVSGHSDELIYCISDVKMEKFESASAKYLGKSQDKKTFTISGSPSPFNGSIERGYDIVAPGMNCIRYNDANITGSDWVILVDARPQYPYLLQAQDRLQIDMKMPYQSAETIYLNRFTVWGSSGKWRIISRSFRPWDDDNQITFHHSTVFD